MKLHQYIGNWGRFQAFVYALMLIPGAISGVMTMLASFTAAVPKNRCALPGIDIHSQYDNPEVQKYIGLIYTSPKQQAGKDAFCRYCPKMAELVFNNGSSNSSAELVRMVENNVTCSSDESIACDIGHVYDRSQYQTSLAITFNMVCDGAWKRDVLKSTANLGKGFGALIFGILSDSLGRKRTFLICSLTGIVAYNITPFLPNLPLICIFTLINAALAYGAFLISFVIVMELVNGIPRTSAGIFVQGYYAVGYVWVGVMAYLIRDWRWLQWAVSIPTIILIPYYWLIPESIQWLLSRDRKGEAKAIIMKAARWNRMELGPKFDQELIEDTRSERATVLDLFKNRHMARNSLIVFFTWFAVANCYYGLSFNSDDLPGSDFVNYIILGLIEFPGYALCIPMTEFWGRRPSLVSLMGFGGISCIASAFISHGSLSWLVVTLAMIGKLCISAAFAIIYNYSAELFPTPVRNAGCGVASLCARIGATSAPYIHILHDAVAPWVPFVIYGGLATIAGVLDIFLPESKGKELPETMEDGISFCKGVPYGEQTRHNPYKLHGDKNGVVELKF